MTFTPDSRSAPIGRPERPLGSGVQVHSGSPKTGRPTRAPLEDARLIASRTQQQPCGLRCASCGSRGRHTPRRHVVQRQRRIPPPRERQPCRSGIFRCLDTRTGNIIRTGTPSLIALRRAASCGERQGGLDGGERWRLLRLREVSGPAVHARPQALEGPGTDAHRPHLSRMPFETAGQTVHGI